LVPDEVRWGWPKREPAMLEQLRHPLNTHSGEPAQAARISELQRRRLQALRESGGD
jgi:hypothetical protein